MGQRTKLHIRIELYKTLLNLITHYIHSRGTLEFGTINSNPHSHRNVANNQLILLSEITIFKINHNTKILGNTVRRNRMDGYNSTQQSVYNSVHNKLCTTTLSQNREFYKKCNSNTRVSQCV